MFDNCEGKKVFAFVAMVPSLCFKDFLGVFMYVLKTLELMPSSYTNEIPVLVDPATPARPLAGHSHY